MRIKTDSTPVEAPKDPDRCSVFGLYRLFASPGQVEQMAERYRAGGMGYAQAKETLFELMWEYFRPYREKREELAENPGKVRTILKEGAEKARRTALPTLTKARKKVGLHY